MKALSVKQPWANLLASGKKSIECRTWYTPYRGQLLIVSSKNPNIPPAGMGLCVRNLIDCRKLTREDFQTAFPEEAAEGEEWEYDIEYGATYAWVFDDNILEIPPFSVRGHLGIYDVATTLPAKPRNEEKR